MAPVVIAVAGVTGCEKPAAPGPAPESLTLSVPNPGPAVPPGGETTVRVQLDRSAGFRKDVQVKVRAPRGVEAEAVPAVVGPTEPGVVTVRVRTYPDTPPGDHVVRVEATPDASRAVLADVTVTTTDPASGPTAAP
jgi:uncharacterized membrane protein